MKHALFFLLRIKENDKSVFTSTKAKLRGPIRGVACLHSMCKSRTTQGQTLFAWDLTQQGQTTHIQSRVLFKSWLSQSPQSFSFFYFEFRFYFLLLRFCTHVWLCMWGWVYVCVEGRGQLSGASSIAGSRDQIQTCTASTFTYYVIFTVLRHGFIIIYF